MINSLKNIQDNIEKYDNNSENTFSIEEGDNNSEKDIPKKIIKSLKVIYLKFLNSDFDKHYYHKNNNNLEWEYLEINDSKKNLILNAVQRFWDDIKRR